MIHGDVVAFLFREARLLDEERFREWLGLFTPDARYWMPGVQARYRANGGTAFDAQGMAYFDDDVAGLELRVKRFEQKTAWAEDPPTRTAHVVTNIELEPPSLVHSIVTVHRHRNETESYQTVARRKDRLCVIDGALRIARRDVFLLETVLLSKNINTFF